MFFSFFFLEGKKYVNKPVFICQARIPFSNHSFSWGQTLSSGVRPYHQEMLGEGKEVRFGLGQQGLTPFFEKRDVNN